MKKPSDNLFQLIESMSGQEKRYFKIFAARHTIGEKNNYLKLFDVIASQKEYDEEKVKAKLKNEKFLKQFFVVKGYLYDMIMKSLDAYYAESSIEVSLRQNIHHIEILYNKALYDQCEKMIEKAEKIALKYEHLNSLLEIINWKFKLIKASSFNKTFDDEIDSLNEQKQLITEKISNYYQYQWLNTKLFSKATKKGWFPRSAEEIEKEYDPIISNSIFKEESEALSLQSKMLFYNTISAYYHLKGETEKSYSYSKKAEEILNKNQDLKESNIEDYIACLSNLVFTSMFLGRYYETFELIKVLKGLKPKSKSLQAKVFTAVYLPETIAYNINGNIKEGLKIIPEIENQLELYGSLIPQREILYIQYNIACLYFKDKNFKNAARFLFLILNNEDMNTLYDLQSKARILNLMVQTELKNTDLLPYLIRSTYRFLIKQQRLYKFEKTVIGFIRKLPDIPNGEINNSFINLKTELDALGQDPYEKKAMDFFGFINWLERKTQKSVV